MRGTGGAWHSYTVVNGLPGPVVNGVGFEADGTAWVLGESGVAVVAAGAGAVTRAHPGAVGVAARAFAVAGDGTRWIGSSKGLQQVAEDGEPEGVQAGRALGGKVGALAVGKDGVVWVAGGQGVSRLSTLPEYWQGELPSTNVQSVFHDGQVLWVGIAGGGLSRFSENCLWEQGHDPCSSPRPLRHLRPLLFWVQFLLVRVSPRSSE